MVLGPQTGTNVQGAASAEESPAKSKSLFGVFGSSGKKPVIHRDDSTITTPGHGNWHSSSLSNGQGAANEQVASISPSPDPPLTGDQAGAIQQVAAVQPPEDQPVQQAPVQPPEAEPVQQAVVQPPEALPPAPQKAAAPEATAGTKSKFVAQLASFQSKEEAMA